MKTVKKLTSVLLVIGMVMALASCGGGGKAAGNTDTPEGAVKGFIGALQKVDMDQAATFMTSDSATASSLNGIKAELDKDYMGAKMKDIVEVMFTGLSVGEVKVTEDGDTATAVAQISNADLMKVMTQIQSDPSALAGATDLGSVFKAMKEKAGSAEKMTKECTFHLVKESDGKWKISNADGLEEIMTGGAEQLAGGAF